MRCGFYEFYKVEGKGGQRVMSTTRRESRYHNSVAQMSDERRRCGDMLKLNKANQ